MPDTTPSGADLSAKLMELKNAIVDSVRAQAKDFLASNKDAEAFLIERAERLAKLSLDYAVGDEAARTAAKADIDIVRQSMENELSSVAVKASKASRDLFKSILSTATDVLIKAIPVIVSAL